MRNSQQSIDIEMSQTQVISLLLLIVESINIAVSLLFLILFSYRFHLLGSFSHTDKYKNYFPKLRIFFSVTYILLSISLISYNLATNSYSGAKWYEYILQGGGGECIGSLILLIQLGVLKMQLNKEQPYTPFHIYYFIYLAIISMIRFGITLVGVLQSLNRDVNLIISALLVVDSAMQLAYWIAKRQTLPKFQDPVTMNIDDLRHQSLAPNRLDFSERSFRKTNEDKFPYIIPFVSIENGKIRIILESIVLNKKDLDLQLMSPPHLKSEQDNKTALIKAKDAGKQLQLLSINAYTVEQIKKLYVLCGRFPLQKKLEFEDIEMTDMVKNLQEYLEELFQDKRWYQPSVLKYLKIPSNRIKEYSDSNDINSALNIDTQMDQTVGMKLVDDKNSIFCSISVYRHLWVSDHYEFYIKAVVKQSNKISYPIKRYSQFEDHMYSLKHIIKILNKNIELPALPKKHLFHWNPDQETSQRKIALERYLRKLCNDYTIMDIPALREKVMEFLSLDVQAQMQGKFEVDFYREIKIVKGQISKALIKEEYVTFYQFKVYRRGIEVKSITKRFSQIEELHNELVRWMHNIQITFKLVTLAQRIYFKSQSHRQQKLRAYLQTIVDLRDIGKVYAVNAFFNVYDNEVDGLSDSSAIQQNTRLKSSYLNTQKGEKLIEMQESNPVHLKYSEQSSRRFSQIMGDLGNEEYD